MTFTQVKIVWGPNGDAMYLATTLKTAEVAKYKSGLMFSLDVGTFEADRESMNAMGNARVCGTYSGILLKPLKPLDEILVPLTTGPISSTMKCNPTGIRIREITSAEREVARLRRLEEEATRIQEERRSQQARRAMLAKLPILWTEDGSDVVIAADQKCLEETITALGLEGLERRKRIGELLLYGCFETSGTFIPVIVLERKPKALRIEIADGPKQGKVGWIRPEWIKAP